MESLAPDPAAVGHGELRLQVEHGGDVAELEIQIDEDDLTGCLLGEEGSQVDREGGLADTTLRRGDDDHLVGLTVGEGAGLLDGGVDLGCNRRAGPRRCSTGSLDEGAEVAIEIVGLMTLESRRG